MAGTASAPASSGNLGPGFDTLAIAFDVRCHVQAEESTAWSIEEDGAEGPLADDDLIARAVTGAVGRPMRLAVSNEIPRARGLGSSSAVAAAAAAAAFRAVGIEPERRRVFEIVAGLEGHGDNAAATVYGGAVAVAEGRVSGLELHPAIIPVIAVPEGRLSTRRARAALPEAVAMPVVVRSLGRLVFLIEGLRLADPALLERARGDELHELPRAGLSPQTAELVAAAIDAGALHAAWSGAGPAVLALTTVQHREAVRAALAETMAGSGTMIEPAVDRFGLR